MYIAKLRHPGSEPVTDLLRGEVAWGGVVEMFDIEGHPEAKRCYAWSFVENIQPQCTTVLEIPPVGSARGTVKVAVTAKGRLTS